MTSETTFQYSSVNDNERLTASVMQLIPGIIIRSHVTSQETTTAAATSLQYDVIL